MPDKRYVLRDDVLPGGKNFVATVAYFINMKLPLLMRAISEPRLSVKCICQHSEQDKKSIKGFGLEE